MKKRNIAAAILLASMMAVSTCAVTSMTAAAEDTTYTITMPTGDTPAHTYVAYQIFAADLHTEGSGDSAKKILSNITWGSAVPEANQTAFLTEVKAIPAFTACNTLTDVLNVLKAQTNDNATMVQFAAAAKKHVDTSKAITQDGSGNFSNLAAGYYLVEDTTNLTGQNDSNDRYMLNVVDDVTVQHKKSVPTLDKKIGTDYSTGTKTNTASIGDTIPYVLKSAVPDMTGYNRYYYVVSDTLEDGLTFNNDVNITIDGTTVPAANYTVTTTGNGFKIVMKEFYKCYYQNNTPDDTTDDGTFTGKDIIITYSATLNKDAELYTSSNNNTVNLTYSNNPNYDYEGNKDTDNPDEPPTTPTAPTGVTPDSVTKTYTTGVQITKKDGANNAALEGVKFRLSGEGLHVTKVDSDYFKLDNTSGTYWQLKDGIYTTTDPTGTGVDTSAYVSTTNKYTKVTDSSEQASLQYIDTEVTTPVNGIITFKGLAPGTYTLTEVAPKPGYNKIDPITITITDSKTGSEINASGWTVTATNVIDNLEQDNTTKCFKFDVINNQGATLPSTGGIGTTIFYVVGGTLVIGAVVLLITKKRMNTSDKK